MKTCVVVGNGPSLRDVPRQLLKRYETFGANRCYLPPVRLIPTYYVCVNPLVLTQNRDEINALDCRKFVRPDCGVDGTPLRDGHKEFSFEPDKWIYEGHTVTFVSLQLAYWLGFETVLLVGVDHRYRYDGKPNEKRRMDSDDPNHFSPDYFKGQYWHNPDLAKAEAAYRMAKDAYGRAGRRILNLTPNSALTTFEKDVVARWM